MNVFGHIIWMQFASLRVGKPPRYFSLGDISLLVFILMLGFFTRTLRIAFPRCVVFDERYFGDFAQSLMNIMYMRVEIM